MATRDKINIINKYKNCIFQLFRIQLSLGVILRFQLKCMISATGKWMKRNENTKSRKMEWVNEMINNNQVL